MRTVLYIAILLSLFFVPLDRVDVSQLLPIETVAIYMENGDVILETDTEHSGSGKTVTQALESLKENTPAVVYLDTAAYLLVSEDALTHVEGLRQYLKPSVAVCICDAKDSVQKAADYLSVHGNLPKLRDWRIEDYTKK